MTSERKTGIILSSDFIMEMTMRKTTAVAMGLFCFSAPQASSQTVESSESVKADSGLRFLESGADRAGVKAPSAVRAAAATPRDSGLSASRGSLHKAESPDVPVPAVAADDQKKTAESSSWSTRQIVGTIAGAIGGAALGLPAIGSGIPLLIAIPGAGLVILAGAGIGYGIVTLAKHLRA